jgi:hypothetical protein
MIIHDIRCPKCEHEEESVVISSGIFPACQLCGTTMRWVPRVIHTDVLGSEQTSLVLGEPGDPTTPMKFTSTREREAKMKAQGFIPAGDRYHGSLGNSDPMKGRIYSRPSDKPVR